MPNEKYDEKKEHQIRLLAENRIQSGQYKIFDHNARVITRKKIDGKNCLVLINGEGETIVITPEFEVVLSNAIK
jgi:hypothetical protein